jgi:uncharacterized protein with HEPN domain
LPRRYRCDATRRESLRLGDIVEAIESVPAHIAKGTFDRKTSDAVLYNLVVIGEAAAQISDETRAKTPEIPWPKIVGLRNLIAHEYFRIDLDVIETIVHEQLDQLERTVRRLLAESE